MKYCISYLIILAILMILPCTVCKAQENANTGTSVATAGAKPSDPSPEERIAWIRPEVDSIPKVVQIVENNPTASVADAALAFFMKLNDTDIRTARGFLRLASHSNEKIAEKFRSQILKMGPIFLSNIRSFLKTGEIQEKKSVAFILSQRGVIEISTFLSLLKNSNTEDQEIAKDSLAQIGASAIPYTANIVSVTENPVLLQNVMQIWYKIGKSNVGALVLYLKNTKGKTKKLLIQSIAKIAENSINPIIEVLRLNANPDVRNAIEDAVEEIGPSIIPELLPLLYDPISEVRKTAKGAIQKFGKAAIPYLRKILLSSDNQEQKKFALDAMAELEEGSLEAIDIIKPLLTESGDLQYPAVNAVQKMGAAGSKKVITELIQAYKQSKDWMVRAAAASALANAGSDASPALEVLQKSLKTEKYGEVRSSICKAIGNMGAVAKPAVPELILCLEDLEEPVVQSAAEALGNIGPSARSSIPNLIQVLSYGEAVRETAAKSLSKMGKDAIPKLVSILSYSEDPGARHGAAIALKFMAPRDNSAVSALILGIRTDDNPLVRKQCALALGEIGPFSSAIIQSLIEASRDPSELVRNAVVEALPKIRTNVISLILSALQRYPEEYSKVTLIRTLGNFGNEAAGTLPLVIKYIQESTGKIQKEAVQTLSKLGEPAKDTAPILVEILKSSNDEELHKLLVKTLVQFGNESIPLLISLLKEEKSLTRNSASDGLDQFGEQAIPALLDVIQKGEDILLISQVVKILGRNFNYLDHLIKLLAHPNKVVRETLKETIVKIGMPAIPKLLEVIVNSNDIEQCNVTCAILTELGEGAVSPLVEALQEVERPLSKKFIIKTIGDIGPKAQMAITPLVDIVIKWKGEDRLMVAESFGKIGPATIPYLINLLQHEDKEIREAAVIALGGTKSQEAISHLLLSLKDQSLLSIVITAIVKIKDMAMPTLLESIHDRNPYIRFACAASLREIASPKAIEALKRQLTVETDPMVKYMIEIALMASGGNI